MAGEGEGEVHNLNGENLRMGGGRRGGGNRGGWYGGGVRGIGRGEENRYDNREDPLGFPIYDEDTTTTMRNISPSILPNFHGLINEDLETFIF